LTTPEELNLKNLNLEATAGAQEENPPAEETPIAVEYPLAEETLIAEEDPPAEEAPPVEVIPPDYFIDSARVQELNRSLVAILLSRRCPSCRAKLEGQTEIIPADKQIREMVKCCVKKEGFIRPEMPLQEIMFRTILASRNKPVSLEDLHDAVTERWYSSINPRSISIEGLKKVLDEDNYYGFAPKEKAPAG